MAAAPVYTTAGRASFLRSYSLTIENGDGSAVRFGNVEVGAASLRFSFSVERRGAADSFGVGGSAVGPRSLVLSNLSPSTRDILQVTSRITLQVGYGGFLNTLLQGQVLTVYSARAGADVNTTLEILDGEQYSNCCFFSRSYAPSTTNPVKLTQILQDIAGTMQLTYANKTTRVVAGVALGIAEQTYPAGQVFNDTCARALTKLLRPQGLSWGISNGALNIVPKTGNNGAEVIVMRPETGLLNVPSSKTVGTGLQTIIFDALMDTRLVPNQIVTFVPPGTIYGQNGTLSAVDSLPGYYFITKSVHKGDTYGSSWDVNLEARVYEGPLTAIPVATTFDYTKAVTR